MKDRLTEAMKEIENLRAQLKVAACVQKEYESLQQKYTQLKALKEQEVSERDDVIQQLRAQLDGLYSELAALRKREQSQLEEIDKQAQATTFLESERERLQDELKKLKTELAESITAHDALKATLKKQREELETTRNALNVKSAKLQGFEASDKQHENEKKRLVLAEARMGCEIDELKKQLQDERDEYNKSLQELTTRANAAEEEHLNKHDQLTKHIAELEGKLCAQHEAFEREREQAKADYNQLLNERDTLKLQLQTMEEEAALTKAQLRRERDGAEGAAKELAALDHERRVQHQKAVGEVMQEREKLKVEINKLKKQITELQTQLETFQNTDAELKACKLTVEKQTVTITELNAKITELQNLNQSRSETAQSATKDIASLQSLLHTANQEKEQLTEENVQLQTQLRKLSDELKKAQADLDGVTQMYNSSISAEEKRKAELEDRIAALEAEMQANKDKLSAAERNLEIEKEATAKSEKNAVELATRIKELLVIQTELESQNEELKQKQKEKDDTIEQGMKKLQQLGSEVQKVIKKLANSEEASESMFTCLVCMEIFKDPIMCIPCGHVFCRDCAERSSPSNGKRQSFCPECKQNNVTTTIQQDTLDRLSGAFVYRKQTLNSLLEIAKSSVTS
eukprot:TRINITY_DN21904_c0_g1_i1.p1 TRINITY_DN21904_c0_g1~~TRINITY_DN21904_c0_g1_i1.p1  ORF type:complete len:633 (-),score=90.70 TRINITY_DN21904_c0_g1_i1:42-1940(-)